MLASHAIQLSADEAVENLLYLAREVNSVLHVEEDSGEPDASQPTMVMRGNKISLYVERKHILEGDAEDSKEFLLLWGIAFYVFNQKTMRKVANTNWFLRSKIFMLKEERTPNPAVVKEFAKMAE